MNINGPPQRTVRDVAMRKDGRVKIASERGRQLSSELLPNCQSKHTASVVRFARTDLGGSN